MLFQPLPASRTFLLSLRDPSKDQASILYSGDLVQAAPTYDVTRILSGESLGAITLLS